MDQMQLVDKPFPLQGTCFWCGIWGRVTRDHVLPKFCGGGDGAENIVPACKPCNFERGEITEFAASLSILRCTVANWWTTPVGERQRMHRTVWRIKKRLKRIVKLADKWRQTEEEKWGRSPSSVLDLSIPQLPRVNP